MKKPRFSLLYFILTPVILLPVAAMIFLVIRGSEAQQIYNRALKNANAGNFAEAAKDFERAGFLGHGESYYSLARIFQSGKLKVDNQQEAVYVNLVRASLHGSVEAAYELGMISLDTPVPDYAQAALYLRNAALGGHALAQYELGKLYEQGRGVIKSEVLAGEFYRKAAGQNCLEAQTALGMLLLTRAATPDELLKAEKLLQAAAARKHARAFTALGVIYEKLSADSDEALAKAGIYYRKAAEMRDPEGLVNYGDWLMRRDRTAEALANYRCAADELDFAPAQHRMGVYFFKLPEPDYGLSRKYFERAAQKGYAASWRNLGIMAELGHGCPPDAARAAKCYKMAEDLNGTVSGKR
ncbi:MAG: sel1 repeat family protein [Lentisphaeria bacterium]|nr:sel1 repeat family protein [Lentisphaeria bacterium]